MPRNRPGCRYPCGMIARIMAAATVGGIRRTRRRRHAQPAESLGERLLARVDTLQRRYGVLGFPFAVVRKYGDDGGWRHAALITYYGFLSVFPILLVAASLLSAVLVNRPTLRQEMVAALLLLPFRAR